MRNPKSLCIMQMRLFNGNFTAITLLVSLDAIQVTIFEQLDFRDETPICRLIYENYDYN